MQILQMHCLHDMPTELKIKEKQYENICTEYENYSRNTKRTDDTEMSQYFITNNCEIKIYTKITKRK